MIRIFWTDNTSIATVPWEGQGFSQDLKAVETKGSTPSPVKEAQYKKAVKQSGNLGIVRYRKLWSKFVKWRSIDFVINCDRYLLIVM